MLRVNFIILLQVAAEDNLVKELMREIPLPIRFSIFPDFYKMFLQPAKSLFLGDTGIRNTVVMIF